MNIDRNDPRLTAYVLGELEESEKEQLEAAIQESKELQEEVEEIRRTCLLLGESFSEEPAVGLTTAQIRTIEEASGGPKRHHWWLAPGLGIAASVLLAGFLFWPRWVETLESEKAPIASESSHLSGGEFRQLKKTEGAEQDRDLRDEANEASVDDLEGGTEQPEEEALATAENARGNASVSADALREKGQIIEGSDSRQMKDALEEPQSPSLSRSKAGKARLFEAGAEETGTLRDDKAAAVSANQPLEKPAEAQIAGRRLSQPAGQKEFGEASQESGGKAPSGESFGNVVLPAAESATGPSPARVSFESAPSSSTEQKAGAGSVSGTVFDTTGSTIPGAEVRLTNLATMKSVMASSDSNGRFRFLRLSAGSYRVEATITGFEPNTRQVEVRTGEESVVAIVLRPGPPTQLVEAGAEVPAMEQRARRGEVGYFRHERNEEDSVTSAGQSGAPPDAAQQDINKVEMPREREMRVRQAMRKSEVQAGVGGKADASMEGPATEAKTSPRFDDRSHYRYPHPYYPPPPYPWPPRPLPDGNSEDYLRIVENPFVRVQDDPRSTFSIDVDTASYANVRRFLAQGKRPPADAVRIEELINYFPYNYPQARGDDPFSVSLEVAQAPWQPQHRLVRVGLKGKEIRAEKRPASNLVFLIDVSGSMRPANKLPLLKESMRLLVNTLREEDSVAIVVYAGASGLVLPPTSGDQKATILHAVEHLQAGGSTNGGAGIELAYKCAVESLIPGGINRVILATDGDFNVGMTNRDDLVRLIENRRRSGVFLTVLGFGMGNLKDSTLEQLADKGNGNYAYIDSEREARKVLVEQVTGTLVTIASDVKIQIEFNPARVQSYRLIGYENRLLAHQDFNDDRRDAGEVGAGHTVTALYEVVPVGAEPVGGSVDPLRYQRSEVVPDEPRDSMKNPHPGELLFVRLRYKKPEGETSRLIEVPLSDSNRRFQDASPDFRFAASVAAFGMLLRDSTHRGDVSFDQVLNWALAARGEDPNGYRQDFLKSVIQAQSIDSRY